MMLSLALRMQISFLAQQPDVFIEFQFDERANNVISRKFTKAGIPIIAIDVPVPGSPFMGADNFGAAWLRW